jgi:N6-adenosine-specific RNA methylase IME4
MKKYQIIYADPPWEYGSITKLGNARNYYKTMKCSELMELNVKDISDDNCLLFMWIVSQKLEACIWLAKEWGFDYVNVGFVWHKPNRTLCGYYTMNQTELCLIFKRGKIPQPRGRRNIREFLSEKATKHSRKPDEIRKRIELMFPEQNKIELFARQKTDGWDVWGNEVESDLSLERVRKGKV